MLHAGADIAFMESPRTKEECAILGKELAPKPVLINVLLNVGSSFPNFVPNRVFDLN